MKILPVEMLHKFQTLIFPDHCISCNRICNDRYFCADCFEKLEPISTGLCPRCGLPMKSCMCRHYFYYWDGVTACFANEGVAQNGVYNLKFAGTKQAAGYFAEVMAATVTRVFTDTRPDMVCAVPMYWKKRVRQGYNQSELLARGIARRLRLPYHCVLKQPKTALTQHATGSVTERFDSISGKYRVGRFASVRGKTVLLVDDIKTTGATASECARMLKLAGARAVFCITALTTLPKKTHDRNMQTTAT